ncbi:hypothetical protein HOK51_11355 [Candidatus Woesearchaeota archaeon]|jgi:hypothetical protein|nr:hypothetical protein [Candidatus Woesearchaeota archaeon]MBT6520419.1 hypothetical protein [Candidatus Woesearchaeota archaeon]MBT7368825.1 hypothetical protein [Candidatus Woesearchaeota archaeon]
MVITQILPMAMLLMNFSESELIHVDFENKVVKETIRNSVVDRKDLTPKDYYYSRPFYRDPDSAVNEFEIVIVPKQLYDSTGQWDDGSANYKEFVCNLLPLELVENQPAIFGLKIGYDQQPQQIFDLLSSKGFMYNRTLDVDIEFSLLEKE